MYVQDYAFSNGTRSFLRKVQNALAIRFYNIIPMTGSDKIQKELQKGSLVRLNTKEAKSRILQQQKEAYKEMAEKSYMYKSAQRAINEAEAGAQNAIDKAEAEAIQKIIKLKRKIIEKEKSKYLSTAQQMETFDIVPLNMFNEFDENRVMLFTEKSIHEWPRGRVGKQKPANDEIGADEKRDPAQGFHMLHRIIEMDLSDMLKIILYSSAFGYRRTNNHSFHANPSDFEENVKQKEYNRNSTIAEKREAWKQCIAIVTDYSVPKCAQMLYRVFIAQGMKKDNRDLLLEIRGELNLHNRVGDGDKKPSTDDDNVGIIAELRKEKVFDFFETMMNQSNLPKHGMFFQKKFMTSVCSDHTVRPYEFTVQSGDDFMKTWIHLLYFCDKVQPVEITCLMYHQIKELREQLETLPELQEWGQIFNLNSKRFRFDSTTFLSTNWLEVHETIKRKNGKNYPLERSTNFVIDCLMLQDCLQRFIAQKEQYQQELELLGLIDDDYVVVRKKKK